MKSLQSVSGELPRTGQRSVSSLHHPIGVETETTDPRKNQAETQPDFFAMRCLVIFVPYDLFMAVEFRIRESGGHIAIMERQHKRGQYKLTVSIPSAVAHQFKQYEAHT